LPDKAAYAEKDENTLKRLFDELPDEDALFDLAELFKIFGDSTRIKILFALLESELSVNDISTVLHMTQSAISHQLRILKANRLVKYRREGKSVIYSLSDTHVNTILSQGLDHLAD
jgi:ArsR family transcriptional regulator, lead/cadmium/zinc/bismuth-responsive transcriptional repressor